jgi:hypothetical protein
MPALETLTDTFPGTSIDTSLWSGGTGGTLSVTSGELSLTPTTGTSYAYAGAIYDLNESELVVQVTGAPSVAGSGGTVLGVVTYGSSDQNSYWMYLTRAGGSSTITLKFDSRVADIATNRFSVTWDPALHAYWRVREEGTTVYFETSADGLTYTERWSGTAVVGITTTGGEVGLFSRQSGVTGASTTSPFRIAEVNPTVVDPDPTPDTDTLLLYYIGPDGPVGPLDDYYIGPA